MEDNYDFSQSDTGFAQQNASPTNPIGNGGFTSSPGQNHNNDGDIFAAASGMNFQGSSNGFGSNNGDGFKPAGQWGF